MIYYNSVLEEIQRIDIAIVRKILENIFGIKVLIYSINQVDKKIVFNIYDGYKYYRFVFFLENTDNNKEIDIEVMDRIIICNIFLKNLDYTKNNINNKSIKFYVFLKKLNEKEKIDFSSFL